MSEFLNSEHYDGTYAADSQEVELVARQEIELAARNRAALQDWYMRVVAWSESDQPALDAYTPMFREALTNWFERKRDLARRWMFKNRCAKRAAVATPEWDRQPVSMFLRKQAD